MLKHKTNLNKLKRTKIISTILSDLNGIKNNQRGKLKIFTNKWRLNKILLNNQWVEEEIKMNLERPKTNEH